MQIVPRFSKKKHCSKSQKHAISAKKFFLGGVIGPSPCSSSLDPTRRPNQAFLDPPLRSQNFSLIYVHVGMSIVQSSPPRCDADI